MFPYPQFCFLVKIRRLCYNVCTREITNINYNAYASKKRTPGKIKIKNKAPAPVAETPTDEEEALSPALLKTKKAIEFELPEPIIAATEDKLEDDQVAVAGEEDSEEIGAEEATLDEEELNPFGDKWEL